MSHVQLSFTRYPTGMVVWRLGHTDLQIMWAGPGSRLRLGQCTTPGGATTAIDHSTANGTYQTEREASIAVRAFLEAAS